MLSNYDMVVQFYEWGVDIKPFIGLWITEYEYKKIIEERR